MALPSSPARLSLAEPAMLGHLDLPTFSGLRERRLSSNITLGRTPITALLPLSTVDSEDEPSGQTAVDFHAELKDAETDKELQAGYAHEELNVFPLGQLLPDFDTKVPGPSIPVTPHGGTTPGNLTPSLDRAATLDAALTPATEKAERYKLRLCAAFMSFFACGWADGTPGTLLPHLEETYHLSHFTVSLLFIFGATGFAIGTVLLEPLMLILGRFSANSSHRSFLPKVFIVPSLGNGSSSTLIGHSLTQGRLFTVLVGCMGQTLQYTIAVTNPPFWALCLAFCFGGIAISIFTGQMNAYVAGASVRTQGRALGTLHGMYGFGAFASPLVCQTLLAKGWPWYQYYWISFGLAMVNLVLMVTAFHTTRSEFEDEKERALATTATGLEMRGLDEEAPVTGTVVSAFPRGTMRATLSMPYVWLFMIFLGFYTGSETTTGGWIVTYLLSKRNANPDTVGYVASGFWGGLAAGRIVLGHASPYIGIRREKHLVHLYIAVSLVMTVLIWLVPSFVGNAVFAACIGWCLGPIFPTSMALATKILPKEVHLTALAVMSSAASIGSAIFPFFAGILASAKGVVYLQPFMCGILGVMGTLWCFFPSRVGMAA